MLKPDSPQAIRALRNMGIRVVMLTGDNARTAKAIGAQAGVDEVIAGVLPDGKEDMCPACIEATGFNPSFYFSSYIFEIICVIKRNQYFCNTGPLGSHQFLRKPTDRKYTSAEGNFTGHGIIRADSLSGNKGSKCCG